MKKTPTYIPHVTTIFYDGWCRLCSGVVGLLLKTKEGKRFTYIPIQQISEYSDSADQIDGNEIAVVVNNTIETGAKAVLIILKNMGGPYSLLSSFLNLLPDRLLQKTYIYIAQNRYRWFGKKTSCELR